jgi:hypothetical protein
VTTDPMANPGRRMAEARKLKRAKRLADPAHLALLRERFTRSPWFDRPPPERPLDDSPLTQGTRRRALAEALNGIEDEEEAI